MNYLLYTVLLVTVVVCSVIFVFFKGSVVIKAGKNVIGILMPFFWGIGIAYLLRPVCLILENAIGRFRGGKFREKHQGLVRVLSILLSLILLAMLVVLLLLAVLPELIRSISGLVSQLPSAINSLEAWIGTLDNGDTTHEAVVQTQQLIDTVYEQVQNFLRTELLPSMQTMVSGVTMSFMNILDLLKNAGLGCIISAYILGRWEMFVAQAKLMVYALLPKGAADWIRNEAHVADRMFSGFIHGKLLDSLIIGILCFLFTTIVRMPYAMLVSVIVGVTNIIPFFGPYLGAIPSALLILTVSPGKCLVFVIFVIVLQQFDGNFLGPRILGDRMGISGFWILFAIMIFSAAWGIAGMVLGVPVFAVIYGIIRSLMYSSLNRRGRGDLIMEYQERFGTGPTDGTAVPEPVKEQEQKDG